MTTLIDKIIEDTTYVFTHVWVDGFGWENTIYDTYDFNKVLKTPIKEDDGSTIFFGYYWNDKMNDMIVMKLKGYIKPLND